MGYELVMSKETMEKTYLQAKLKAQTIFENIKAGKYKNPQIDLKTVFSSNSEWFVKSKDDKDEKH